MADETAPTSKTILGRSRIFTPEVINDIHMKAELGRYRMRGFSIFKKIPHWDELVFLPGTLTRFVIEGYREKCETRTVLGARFAKRPLELDIPIYITGMSFGALSLEAKMALAKGASMAGTATCSGEASRASITAAGSPVARTMKKTSTSTPARTSSDCNRLFAI
ncbi:MAG: glutamate synthase-related protein [Gaiellaceae bacterium]|nr:glutamate synthase-related protein [Gaiellaceae bacterium]